MATPDAQQPNGKFAGERADMRLTFEPPDTYFLIVGETVLKLSEADLALLGRAIHVMAGRHPTLLARLIAPALHDEPKGPHEGPAS